MVPAHNSAQTLAETLDSLLRQTADTWEAIVVDDGSADRTAALVRDYRVRDQRFRLLKQRAAGPAAARNRGISAALGRWLLFLDSDDWLADNALETFLTAADQNPEADVLCARWTRVAPGGALVPEDWAPDLTDPFPMLARFCPFAIHSCLIRTELVDRIGGFDERLRVAEDWDLWQRAARIGARFTAVPAMLAFYRMREASAGLNVDRLLVHGLDVIGRAHAPAPPSKGSSGTQAEAMARKGVPKEQLPNARLNYVCWPAGMLIALGQDPRHVIHAVLLDSDPGLEPSGVANTIFRSALLPHCLTPDKWTQLWPKAEAGIDAFLGALEMQSGAPGLARRAKRELARLVMKHGRAPKPLIIGPIMAMDWSLEEAAADIEAPGVERLLCTVRCDGAPLGDVELPVIDEFVLGSVLVDAVAARFFWQILRHCFQRTIYPTLRRDEDDPRRLMRGELCLLDDMGSDLDAEALHDRIGWAVFLQELWERPAWPAERFYEEDFEEIDSEGGVEEAVDAPIILEVSETLPAMMSAGDAKTMLVTAGGRAVTRVAVDWGDRPATAQRLRAIVTARSGLELCRVAVREALMGKPWSDGLSLRGKLREAARQHAGGTPTIATSLFGEALGPDFVIPVGVLPKRTAGLVFARHRAGPPGTSASRRAQLPATARDALLRSARANGETVVAVQGDSPQRLVYAPDLIPLEDMVDGREDAAGAKAASFDRHYFETMFIDKRDPWKSETAYEQLKYEQTLSLIPDATEAVLELACAEGNFTRQLAPKVGSLLATDISVVALKRASERCRDVSNVSFQQLDFTRAMPPGPFDLIICSEVLYYLEDEDRLREFADRVAASLKPGGWLIGAHTHGVGDDGESRGFDADTVPFGAKRIGEILSEVLQLETELQSDLYRVQRFRRPGLEDAAGEKPIFGHIPCNPPGGGERVSGLLARPLATDRLPILMYHTIAPEGPPAQARYRVTPERFEEQLSYLRDAGFRGVTLDEWRFAKEQRKPLPGRAVMLTFDDGFADFHDHAWPLLQHYGFSALVFLVTGRVGLYSDWDEGVELPLSDWGQIRKMHEAGIEFGSHAVRHLLLTGLSPAEIVQETAASRAALANEISSPVTAFAYPFGAEDEAIQHLVGASGYLYGLSCRPGASSMTDPLLALRRIEVEGNDTLEAFIRKLNS